MKLRFAGKEIYLSIAILPLLAFQIVIGETKALFCAVCALLLHETAHWIALRNLGYTVCSISVFPFGAVMHLSSLCADSRYEWIAAAAGPLGSFLIACAVRTAIFVFRVESEWLLLFYEVNLVISAINLLPAYPLDGGRIAKAILLQICGERWANRLVLLFSAFISLGFVGIGIYLIGKGIPAWSFTAIGAFLIGAAVHELGTVKGSAVPYLLSRNAAIRDGRAQKAQIIAIRSDATVGEAMQLTSRIRYTIFYTTNGRYSFTIDENRILDAASKYGYAVKITDVFDRQEIMCYNNKLKIGNQIGEDG